MILENLKIAGGAGGEGRCGLAARPARGNPSPSRPRTSGVARRPGALGQGETIASEFLHLRNRTPSFCVATLGPTGGGMAQSQRYRAYAEQCVALASKMTGDQRAYMLEMARAWHQLAQDQEQVERLERSRETAEEQEPILRPSSPT
jgi:hypothetical protein